MRCRYAGTAWVSARGKTDFNSPASPSTTTVLVRSRRSLTSTLLKSDGCKDAFADWPRWLQRENLTSGGAARKQSKLNKIITPGRSSYQSPLVIRRSGLALCSTYLLASTSIAAERKSTESTSWVPWIGRGRLRGHTLLETLDPSRLSS